MKYPMRYIFSMFFTRRIKEKSLNSSAVKMARSFSRLLFLLEQSSGKRGESAFIEEAIRHEIYLCEMRLQELKEEYYKDYLNERK